jgi:hypothetical protein
VVYCGLINVAASESWSGHSTQKRDGRMKVSAVSLARRFSFVTKPNYALT